MKFAVPNLKEVLKPEDAHKPGYGISTKTGKFKKQKVLEQGSTPEDKQLLKKLKIQKKDKVLAIAGYYASWASEIAKLGPKVNYSDISMSMVKWAKKKYGNLFGKYICSNYELIPKKENEYDWTFTFEACGGRRGLPIAYLRSLLNTKGGILVLWIRKEKPENMGSKLRQYPKIVKAISEIYDCACRIKIMKIKSRTKGNEKGMVDHQVCWILTNDKARQLAKQDLEVLEKIQKKTKILPEWIPSIKRINRLTLACIEERFHNILEIK